MLLSLLGDGLLGPRCNKWISRERAPRPRCGVLACVRVRANQTHGMG